MRARPLTEAQRARLRPRTSDSDPIRIDWLPGDQTAPGRVGLTFAPGKKRDAIFVGDVIWKRDLDTDLGAFVEARVNVLVTLLEAHELVSLRIPTLFDNVRRASIEVVHLPVRDVDVPRDPARLRALLTDMHDRVAAGQNLVVHCAGGLGRSGVVAGCFLVAGGMPAESALAILAAVRGPCCPETRMQAAFVRGFELTQRARERRKSR